MRVFFSPLARADLIDIGAYIKAVDPDRASDFVAALTLAAIGIGLRPLLYGYAPLLLPERRFRRRLFSRYAIYFRIGETEVEIVRIIHESRDIEGLEFPLA